MALDASAGGGFAATASTGDRLVGTSGAGRFEDGDGRTHLGGLTVDGRCVVRLTLLDTVESAPAGAPFALLVFGT